MHEFNITKYVENTFKELFSDITSFKRLKINLMIIDILENCTYHHKDSDKCLYSNTNLKNDIINQLSVLKKK